jgi:hypothetical protein
MQGDEIRDQARLDSLLGTLKIPETVHETLRLRLEPLERLRTGDVQDPGTMFGMFVMWRPDSVLNGVADVTHLVDLPTCLSVRRACRERGIYVVDNTGLPPR